MRARFITLEGLDGAGKSTHIAFVRDFLESRGVPACVTREPGGTPLGETLRGLLLDRDQRLDAETETLLMFAARREHIAQVIAPALGDAKWVVSDRFTDASYAYQSGGSGVPWEKIAALEQWAHPRLQPDLTVYFDVAPDIARARTSSIKAPDRYEQEAEAFHARVRAAYLRRARECAGRIRVVDAARSVAAVESELGQLLSELLEG